MATRLVDSSKRTPQQDLSAALERKRLLVDLGENKGYLLLSSLLQEQVDALQQDILYTPCTSVDSAMGQEYKKGELRGRLSWEEVRAGYIESLDVTIKHLRIQVNDDADGTTDPHTAP